MLNQDKIIEDARKMAAKPKPFWLKKNDKLYTAIFDMREWVYNVYEDGVLLIKINMKTTNKAKKFLIEWLDN